MSKGERATPAYIRMIITLLAGLLTIVLTAVAFWLSYEHLHDVAGDHGLSGERAWAWPATLDMFIVIGELLILRASLMQKIDPWSWVCASIGSVGSITLNVVGVGKDAGTLDYVIAAVPPVAALLAFGILMRQLHEAITAYVSAPPKIVPGARTVPPGVRVFDGDEDDTATPRRMPLNEMIEEAEELSDPGPDAMRYEPGDEDMIDNASIDYLRRSTLEDNVAVSEVTTEELSRLLADVRAVSLPPRPNEPPDRVIPWGDMIDEVERVPAVRANGHVSPERARSITADMSAVGPDTTRKVSGSIPDFVRSVLSDDPDATDPDIKSAVRDEFGPDTKPDTIRKAINRTRKSLAS
jgi:hypothetical protein